MLKVMRINECGNLLDCAEQLKDYHNHIPQRQEGRKCFI